MNRPLILALSLLVAALFLASLVIGPAGIPPLAALRALVWGEDPLTALVLREVRAPRAVLALLIGAGLGCSGAVMQGYLRNPLAEPGLLGVSGAAALGAVLALQTGLASSFALALPLAALAGAAAAVGMLLLLAGPRGGSLTLILAGIGVSAVAGAGVTLALNLSPNPFAANEAMFWLMGSLADRSWTHVAIAAPLILGGVALLSTQRRALAALTLGEGAAQSLGFDLVRLRLTVMLGLAAVVGAATAVAGAVGFVGLVAPHVLRRFVRADPAALLTVSALGGAALVLAADIAVRVILPGRDLKLGVLMALIGAPFFVNLILRQRLASS
ncbi:iron ABC transporter permease [Neomegalonema sp.]|uniref:FecCD family ABC transporter permease n=1 Tax=Neomegalonema sp. TaxID=2039713 RepID=UPI00260E7669|nr:iron ABC transporter permease [Neomegalonema sp.]MDD2867804.1 iron ABC transporter permease [Neomegalonema sp.]